MRSFLAALVVLAAALPAAAQPWYARGEFNGWDTSIQMVDQGGGHYTATALDAPSSPGAEFYREYKLANADWSISSPNSNGKVATDVNGEINFHLYDQTTWSDGWYPNNARRAGYNDPGMFGWEIVGSFNGWSGTADPNYALASMGSGLYHGEFAMNPGAYEFKFRKPGDWAVAIGNDFGKDAANNTFRVWSTGEMWNFDLDLPNGRWRAYTNAPSPDRNNDSKVDARDYVLWRNDDGSTAGYNVWRANFGYGTSEGVWYVRGEFNNYSSANQLTSLGGNNYSTTVTGLTPGTNYKFRVTDPDSAVIFPTGAGNDVRTQADVNGEIQFYFKELKTANWGDGWSPDNSSRVGYRDSDQFDWEIMGSFNGWSSGLWLDDQGNGLHTGSFTFDAGTHQFKFRQQGNWDISIGDNFGNSAGNNSITVANTGDTWNFELDLPNGRWRVFPAPAGLGAGAVPEPASISLVLMGLALGLGRARRK